MPCDVILKTPKERNSQMENYNPKTITTSQNLLDGLFEAVKIEESVLSGGVKLGMGAEAVDGSRQTKIIFGNPRNNFIRLTPQLFKQVGLELAPIHRRQMKDGFDFYYMTLAVTMQPARGACFSRLECKLDYGPKGSDEPIIQNLFPQSVWKEYLQFGYNMNLGLDGNLAWKAGVNAAQLEKLENLSADLKADIGVNNAIKVLAVIPNYSYSLGKTEITAAGEGDSSCFWRIETPDLAKGGKMEFGIVLKAPKTVSSIELTGVILAKPDMQWLTANLSDVFEALNDKLKAFILRKGQNQPLISDHERWEIEIGRSG